MAKIKSDSTIRRHLREVREFMESTDDPIEKRVAYVIEQAVRWARQPVVSWPGLAEEARTEAMILKREIEAMTRKDEGQG